MGLDISHKIKLVALPVKLSAVSSKSERIEDVLYLARAGVDTLSAEAEEIAALIGRPTYTVLVDQYMVDLSELTPEQRLDARKTLQKVEIAEKHIKTGALMMAVFDESEADDE